MLATCAFGAAAQAEQGGDTRVRQEPATTCAVTINNHTWQAEYVASPAGRERGLMFRRSMPAASGMLFRFDDVRPVHMWMKNTFIPLDMIFVRDDRTVGHVHRGAVPHSLQTISSGGPVRFVLEVNAGEALSAGIKAGQPVAETCSPR